MRQIDHHAESDESWESMTEPYDGPQGCNLSCYGTEGFPTFSISNANLVGSCAFKFHWENALIFMECGGSDILGQIKAQLGRRHLVSSPIVKIKSHPCNQPHPDTTLVLLPRPPPVINGNSHWQTLFPQVKLYLEFEALLLRTTIDQ